MFDKYNCKPMSGNNSSCNLSVCDLTSTNKDDLEWTQKKHDMLLNLELTSKNSANDETPTPTRFIRNCEEVGLFQDLQNVNPFDEVFKKAVENPSSMTLQVPVSSSDDTLHTPQIYPSLEENSGVNNTAEVYSLSNVIAITDKDKDDIENDLVIVLDSEEESAKNGDNSGESMRDKIKTALIKKANGLIAPVPINKLKEPQKLISKEITPVVLYRRERNRASASRSRKKKQKQLQEMKMEIGQLKSDNRMLIQMNRALKERVKYLETRLKGVESTASLSSMSDQQNIPMSVMYERPLEDAGSNITNADNTKIKKYKPIAIKSVPQLIPIQQVQNSPNNNTVIVIVNGTSPNNSRIVIPAEQSIISVNNDANSSQNVNDKTKKIFK